MIRLFDYLNESIFDDEEKHMDDMENKIYNELLKGSDFVVGTDKKTIVFSPEFDAEKAYLTGYSTFDRRIWLGKRSSIYVNLNKIKSAKMHFQPLYMISVDSEVDATCLYDFPVSQIVSLGINLEEDSKNIDLSKVKFDIINTIYINGNNQKIDINPYKKHVSRVEYKYPYIHQRSSQYCDNIYGWDCDELIVPHEPFECPAGTYPHGEGLMYGYVIEKIQKLINDNPNAKIIYLYNKDTNSYWKVNTKGGRKRIFDKLVNRKPKDQRSEYLDAQEYVWGWEAQHQDLFPNR